MGSLWFCSAPTLTLVTRGPQALMFLALDKRVQAERGFGSCRLGVDLGTGCVFVPVLGACLASLLHPHPLSALFLVPGKGRWTQADTCSVLGVPSIVLGSGIFLLR